MTMDDESSVYVGGLSYDTTEDSLRQKFEAFGPIVTVKIIIDRDSGNSRGYGFVTFTNPRAATKAINGMDGGSLEGRTIRVNDVTNKNGRNFGRENGHYGTFRDRGRGRDNRDFRIRGRSGNARQFSPPRNRRLSSRAFHSDRDRLPTHHRSHSPEGGYSPSRSVSPGGRREDPNSDSPSPSPSPQSPDRLQDTDAMLERQCKRGRKAAKGREDDVRMIKVELERANQRRDELRIKAASLEEENVLKEQQIVDLQNEFQKLEEAFSNAVAASSQKQNQLQKLQKAFLQVRNYTECLQYSEKVLQALVNGASFEVKGAGTELHAKHGGKAWLESEDMEWKDDDDGGHVNIDD